MLFTSYLFFSISKWMPIIPILHITQSIFPMMSFWGDDPDAGIKYAHDET